MFSAFNLLKTTNFRDLIRSFIRLFVKDMSQKMKYPEIFVQVVSATPKYVVSDSVLTIDASIHPQLERSNEIAPGKIILIKNWRFAFSRNNLAHCAGLMIKIDDFEINNRFHPKIAENLVSFEEDEHLMETRTILSRYRSARQFNNRYQPEEAIQKIQAAMLTAKGSEDSMTQKIQTTSNRLRKTNFRDRIKTFVQLLVKGQTHRMDYPKIHVQIVSKDQSYVVSDSILKMNTRFKLTHCSQEIVIGDVGDIILTKAWSFSFQKGNLTNYFGLEVIIEDFELISQQGPIIPEKLASFEEDPELGTTRVMLQRFAESARFNIKHHFEKSIRSIKAAMSITPRSEEPDALLSQDDAYSGAITELKSREASNQPSSEDSVQTGFFSVPSSMFLELIAEEKKCDPPMQSETLSLNAGKTENKLAQSEFSNEVASYPALGGINEEGSVYDYHHLRLGEQHLQYGLNSEGHSPKRPESIEKMRVSTKNSQEARVEGCAVTVEAQDEPKYGRKRNYFDIFQLVFHKDFSQEEDEVTLPLKKGNFISGKNSPEKLVDQAPLSHNNDIIIPEHPTIDFQQQQQHPAYQENSINESAVQQSSIQLDQARKCNIF